MFLKGYVFQYVFHDKIGIRIQVSWFLNQYLYSLPLASSNCIWRTSFHSREIFSFLRQLIRRPIFLETCLLYGSLEFRGRSILSIHHFQFSFVLQTLEPHMPFHVVKLVLS